MKLRSLIPVFLFVVWANVPFWLASHCFGLVCKGLFNVELLLLGIAALFLPPAVTALSLLGAVTVDMFSGVSVTFLFTASETWHGLRWVPQLAPGHRGGMALIAVTLAIALGLAMFSRVPSSPARRSSACVFVVLSIVCIAVDLAAGKAASWGAERQFNTPRLSRTPLRSLWVIGNPLRKQPSAHAKTPLFFTVASAVRTSLPSTMFQRPPNAQLNIVLVLVESWGLATDPRLAHMLLQPFNDPTIEDKYTVRSGTVPFHGPTIDGEARELCSMEQGFSLLQATSDQLAVCLPAAMARLGYHTVGVHGFIGRMYGRRDWWKTVGFDELWFREELESRHLPTCPGAFPGICDTAVAAWIGDTLERPSPVPSFFYWVTLNSHLPVPIPNQVEHPASCSGIAAVSQSLALCSWFQLIVNTQRSVAALALRPSSRPTAFLIVGDHTPPFSTPALRNQFSDRVVPYVLLLPRSTTVLHSSPSDTLLAAPRTPRSTRRAYTRAAKASRARG